MANMSNMPWEILKGETIRAVARDLGLLQYVPRANRRKLIRLLREVESNNVEPVILRLQQRARAAASRARVREESPELEYAGSSTSPTADSPVPAKPLRTYGRSRRILESSEPSTSSGSQAPPSTKKAPIPPPSYAILYQLEQEISTPSAEPIPLLHPDQRFDGVVIPPPPRWAKLPSRGTEDEPESISRGRPSTDTEEDEMAVDVGRSPTSRRLEAVVVTVPVETVKMQWKQGANIAGRL
ncbi:hypothetical protein FKP32DRAFT_1754367 [Trametes sanguinea]|nr:hypothetical protein FKP32DRAFT_1754367 [Trametes sanguinea]